MFQVQSPAKAGSPFRFGIAGSGMDMRHSAPFGPSSHGCCLEQSKKTVEKCPVVLCKENFMSHVCFITVNLAVCLHNCFSVLIGK